MAAAGAGIPTTPPQPPSEKQKPATEENYVDLHHPRNTKDEKQPFGCCSADTGHLWWTKDPDNVCCAALFCFTPNCCRRCCCCHCCCGLCGQEKSDFKDYGAGITEYFKFLKWGSIVFLVIALLYTPVCVANWNGQYHKTQGSLLSLGRISVGNLGDSSKDVELPESFCNSILLGLTGDCTMPKQWISRIYAALNALSLLILVVAWLWARYFVQEEEKAEQANVNTVQNYTVYVPLSPNQLERSKFYPEEQVKRSPEEQVAYHFEKLLDCPKPIYVNLVHNDYSLKDQFEQKKKLDNRLGKCSYTLWSIMRERRDTIRGQPVKLSDLYEEGFSENVTVGQSEHILCRMCRCSFFSYDAQIGRVRHKQYELLKKLDRTRRKLVGAQKEIQKISPQYPVGAFVTFQRGQDVSKCFSVYPSGFLSRFRQPSDLYLNGKPIQVRKPPPPDTIKWHNIGYPKINRACRLLQTYTLSLGLLFGGFIFSYFLAVVQDQLGGSRVEICRQVFDDFSNYVDSPNTTLPLHDEEGRYTNDTMRLCRCELVDFDSKISEEGIDSVKETDEAEMCQQQFCMSVLFNSGLFHARSNMNDADCAGWFRSWIGEQSMSLAAAGTVLFVNLTLKVLLERLSVMEKYSLTTSRLRSVTWRLFALMYTNTSVVPVLIHVPFVRIPFVSGAAAISYNDFLPDWYVFVGTSISLTMLLYIVAPHISPLWKGCKTCRRRNVPFEKFPTEQMYNEYQLGPEMPLTDRYTSLMNVFFTVLTYSGGMPLLWWVGFACFTGTYWIDKYMFCHIYRTPPRYDAGVLRTVLTLVPLAFVLHGGVSMWMYTAPSIFRINEASGDDAFEGTDVASGRLGDSFVNRITAYSTTVPILSVMVILLLFVLIFILRWIFRTITCTNRCFESESDENCEQCSYQYSYDEAKLLKQDERGSLKGVPSYRILEHPKYKEMTGISNDFLQTGDGAERPKLLQDAIKYMCPDENLARANTNRVNIERD